MDKEKFEKLAPWLKNEIKLLENKIKNLENIIKTLSLENNEQTNIFLEKEGVKKYISNREIIYFLISNEELNVCLRNNKLEIIGSDSLKILPKSSNGIEISF